MGVISEGKAALELTRELVSYLKKAGEHDPKLVGLFEDLREKVLALYESDIELRQQVRELEEKLQLREKAIFNKKIGAYYTGSEECKEGPFCAKCFHERKELVPMKNGYYHEDCIWECPVCGMAIGME